MSTLSLAARDSATMLRRNLLHALRYPSLSLGSAGMPILFMLLFVYVLGGALGAGVPGVRYIDYLAPGIILMTVTGGTVSAAVSISMDMTKGIITRFRTMAIARVSVLTGHVVGNIVTTMVSIPLVIGVALLVGFRPTATFVEWIATLALLALLTLALTWLSMALALLTKGPEGASNIVLPLTLLPFLGSAFVPPESMTPAVRVFAEYQPFTPINETLRGLLMGTPIGNSGVIAIGWCVVLTVVGYLWAKRLFNRQT
jgi:ABC-2 type transport system permease protein